MRSMGRDMDTAKPSSRPTWGRNLAYLTAITAAALLAGAGMRLVTWEAAPMAERPPTRLEFPPATPLGPPPLGDWRWRRETHRLDDTIRNR